MSVGNVMTAIATQLVANQGAGSFYESVGGRIYHLFGPEQMVMPACVFGVADSASPNRDFVGNDFERYVIQFDIWVDVAVTGGTPDVTAMDIEDKLRRQLDRQILTATGYDRITCLCISRGEPSKDGDAIRVSAQYEVKGTRTS